MEDDYFSRPTTARKSWRRLFPSFLFVRAIYSVIPPLSTLVDVTNSLKKNHWKSKQHDGNANWLHRRHPGRADAGGLLLGGELRGPSDRKEVQHRRSEWALLLFKILDGSNYQQQQLEGELGTYNRSVKRRQYWSKFTNLPRILFRLMLVGKLEI